MNHTALILQSLTKLTMEICHCNFFIAHLSMEIGRNLQMQLIALKNQRDFGKKKAQNTLCDYTASQKDESTLLHTPHVLNEFFTADRSFTTKYF